MSEPSINRGFGRPQSEKRVVQKCHFCPSYTLSVISHDGHIICYNCENKRLNRKDHAEKNIPETVSAVPGGLASGDREKREGEGEERIVLKGTGERKKAPVQKTVLGKGLIYTLSRPLAR